ncbi:hypothetical protein [Weissella viridescens]|uniref:hypothetical protein n=1 Tax=Weissella viridescens TaxID=1629 RepID=UPI003AF231A1
METIEEWIIEDICKAISQSGFSIEKGALPYLHATTNSKARVVIYNPETVTLFELAEEMVHAQYRHSRQQREYDVRNSNEGDAHQKALQYLLDRWCYYEGSENWLTFVTVTGTPCEFSDDVERYFDKDKKIISQGHVSLA